MPNTAFAHGISGGQEFMRPPPGFESEKWPLRHKLQYSFGISAEDADLYNSVYMTLVRNYKTLDVASTVIVNPKHATFEVDAGSMCRGMSIITNLKLAMHFNLTHHAIVTEKLDAIKFSWTPVFNSFPEKLLAADDRTTTTVESILGLVSDTTEEDVVPVMSTKLDRAAGSASFDHPLSTANETETIAMLGLTTNATMESTAFNRDTFFNALRYYTNKGALKTCLGRTRNVTLTKNNPHKSFFIQKFVPSAIRRIVPYSFFGILIHVPNEDDIGQIFHSKAMTNVLNHIGCRAVCTYDEWNDQFHQEMD